MIKVAYFVESDGGVYSVLTGPSLEGMPAPLSGQLAALTDYSGSLPAYWNGESVQAIPDQPSPAHVWNWATKQWIHSLTEARVQAWDRIKASRDAAEFGTFTWNDHVFDGDSESQRRIQGAAQLAILAQAMGQPFSIDWTLANNAQVALSASDMVGVGSALGQKVSSVHGTARGLREVIQGALTQNQLDAIQWPS